MWLQKDKRLMNRFIVQCIAKCDGTCRERHSCRVHACSERPYYAKVHHSFWTETFLKRVLDIKSVIDRKSKTESTSAMKSVVLDSSDDSYSTYKMCKKPLLLDLSRLIPRNWDSASLDLSAKTLEDAPACSGAQVARYIVFFPQIRTNVVPKDIF